MNDLTTPAAPAPSTGIALTDQQYVNPNSMIFNPQAMEAAMRLATFMAKGKMTTPKHLRGNEGDCLAVVLQALRWGFDPTAVASKTHVVNEQLGYEAQLVIAAINTSGRLKPGDSLSFEWFGPWEKIVGKFKSVESKTKKDDNGNPKVFIVPDWNLADEKGLGVRCTATLRNQSTPKVLELFMTQARTRNSTLWTEDPKQQLAYLAGKRWGRLYCPEVILGVYTPDELRGPDDEPPPRNMGAAEVVGQDRGNSTTPAGLPAKRVAEWRAAAKRGFQAAQDFWHAMSRAERLMATEEQKVEMRELADKVDRERTVDNGTKAGATDAPQTTEAKTEGGAPAPAAAEKASGDDGFTAALDAAEEARQRTAGADEAGGQRDDGASEAQ